MDLLEAYGVGEGDVVAAVGGGGRTELVYALARAAASRGTGAVISTTTKLRAPSGRALPRLVEAGDADIAACLASEVESGEVVVATSGRGARNRMLGFEPATFEAVAAATKPGLLVVDADGSAHRPFKAPAEHEPALPECATLVIVCVGLEVLGRRLDEENVHRPGIVSRLAACLEGTLVTADMVVEVLTHADGGRKNVPPGARLSALLHAPPTADHERLGCHIAERLVYAGFHRGVVADARREDGVLAVVR